jgi:Na+/proline symporter
VAAGVYGVVWTDLVEFVIALGASYFLMFQVWAALGHGAGLHARLDGLGAPGSRILTLFPATGLVFVYYFFIGPLVAQGGYNPGVQRFLCVKSEREVIFTSVFNAVISFTVKSWPFYLVGIASIFLLSDARLLHEFPALRVPTGGFVPDYERIYPALARRYLPPGMLGLMLAGFVCGFMSGFATNLHNSTAIFTNDIYRAYLRPGKSEATYVAAARWYMVFGAGLTVLLGVFLQDILRVSMFTLSLMVSAGLVKLLRFCWWRINGPAEVGGQLTSLVSAAFFLLTPSGERVLERLTAGLGLGGNDAFFVVRQLTLTSLATTCSLVIALLTAPEPMPKLEQFYRQVRPWGWWAPVRSRLSAAEAHRDPIWPQLVLTAAMIGIVFGSIFSALGVLLAVPAAIGSGLPALLLGLVGLRWATRQLYSDPAPGTPQPAVAGPI